MKRFFDLLMAGVCVSAEYLGIFICVAAVSVSVLIFLCLGFLLLVSLLCRSHEFFQFVFKGFYLTVCIWSYQFF